MSVFGEPLVLVDIETNGLNHIRGRVIEVAAIRVEQGRIVHEFRKLIDPGSELPQFITNLTGITPKDLRNAPLFLAIADKLFDILDGAIFVAHNVRFDYSFLKQEFRRIGKSFSPRQLCTVRLSRALYPQYRTHKLHDLIARHNLKVDSRHRAYDDAHALWQFLRHIEHTVDPEVLRKALACQLKKPSLPKGLPADALASLPEAAGVYIMEDEAGQPIYVGKSINIKKRVASHFTRDHENTQEFNIAQHVKNITVHQTDSELEALLLESRLVKEMLPLYNKKLRKVSKVMLAKRVHTDAGYIAVHLEEANPSDIPGSDNILAVYSHRGKARESLDRIAKDWQLCPKLLGLEKSKGACFLSQLGKCQGACVEREQPGQYNNRLLTAFAHSQVDPWPYPGPMLVQEKTKSSSATCQGLIVDRWCVIAKVRQDAYCEPVIETLPGRFDLDAYSILKSYLTTKLERLIIQPLPPRQLRLLAT
ncbi:MAG TPA: exonuclease domain-containing protein [Candidatus Saccharimonadales bacterium]|nr:exonuclease domain-containing protein [Candidatus Saccharimonadales bacterium]